ncbi:MAG: response regulator [Deltaproteobacteria bacterium]|nr:response regulator [Candidatus Zymogenaceae bacterium]
MSLIETHCPKCKKKIFLDLEEVVSDSAVRPIRCSQCGNEFMFGFDSEAYPVSENSVPDTVAETKDQPQPKEQGSSDTVVPKTRLVKRLVMRRVPKARPKADKRILIIEDSALTRQQVVDLFSDDVQNIVALENAEEGLKELRQRKPDLLIVDLVLPQMSGAELITIALKYIPTKSIIIFTAAHTTNLDIFDEGMEGITLVFKGGADSFEELSEKGMRILGLE